MNIFTIPKNASQTLTVIKNVASGNINLDLVVIREPFDRFISASKTVHPEFGIFGGFPPTYQNMPYKIGHFDKNATPQDFIDYAIQNLGKTNYLCTQMSIIGENRFDEVLKFDTLIDDLKSVIEKYNIKLSGENVLDIHYHNSPHELDDLMIKYTKEKYQKIIEDYFYDDFSIYVDHSPLLKENK